MATATGGGAMRMVMGATVKWWDGADKDDVHVDDNGNEECHGDADAQRQMIWTSGSISRSSSSEVEGGDEDSSSFHLPSHLPSRN
eukprot:7916214-Pyramimonas_sp.AAC.1